MVTDATSHNLEVEKLLAEQLQVESIPDHLLCHVHPALMFTRELDSVFKEIEEKIGRDKIFASFNVMPDSPESVITQFNNCLSRFLSNDFDHKPWNKAPEFNIFIHPRKNFSIRLATERFTRYTEVCAKVLHHDADCMEFLAKYDHITNNLACILRAFESVEFLRVFCLVGALIGLHLLEPFVKLTSSSATTYSHLQTAFPILHSELTKVDPEKFFQVTEPALSFTSSEIFHSAVR